MVALTLRASGPLAADEAWERYARPALWPSWSPQIRRVSASAVRMAAGVTGRVYGPLGVSVDFVVETWDEPGRRWSWTARRGPVRLRLGHDVTARDDGCETSLRVSGPLPVVLGYAPIAQIALRRLVR